MLPPHPSAAPLRSAGEGVAAVLARLYGRVTDACALLAAMIILFITVMITADVILRNVARYPLPGSVELTEYAMLLITALMAPWLLKRGQHVRIDVVLRLWPARAGWLCEIVCDVLGLVLSILLALYGVRVAIASAQLGTVVVKDFQIPEWWVLSPLPFMFALLALGFVLRLHAVLAGPRQPRSEGGQI